MLHNAVKKQFMATRKVPMAVYGDSGKRVKSKQTFILEWLRSMSMKRAVAQNLWIEQ
jgi:hypothetical protein